MQLNLKKVLLTGTALVAVAGFAGAAQAQTVVNGADATIAADTAGVTFQTDHIATVDATKNITAAVTTTANGQGTLTFAGASTVTGAVGTATNALKAINVAGALTQNGNVFVGTVAGAGTIALGAGSVLTATGNYTTGGTTLGADAGLTFNGTTAQTVAGTIAGAVAPNGVVTVANAAGVTFGGAISNLSAFNVNTGAVATLDAALGSNVINNAGTLNAKAALTAGNLANAGVINTGTLNVTEGITLAGNLSGTGKVVVADNKTLTHTGTAAVAPATNVVIAQGGIELGTGAVYSLGQAAGTTNLNAPITTRVNGQGTVTFADTGASTVVLGADIGTSTHALAKVQVTAAGNAVAIETARNIYATEVALGDNDSLNLFGNGQTVSGNVTGTGNVNVGREAAAPITQVNANATVGGTIAARNVFVGQGSTLNISNNVTSVTANDFNGTLNVNAATTVADITIGGATTIDGVLNSNINSPRNAAVGTGTTKVLTFTNDVTIGAARNTVINTANEIVANGQITLGHITDARTVTLNIGRSDYYQAATNNTVAGAIDGLNVLRFTVGDLGFANVAGNTGATAINNKLIVGLANNGTYSFDHNDVLDVVVGSTGGIQFTNAGVLNQNVILGHTALVRMSHLNANGDRLAASDNNLTVRLTHVNPHSVITNNYGANAATAVMNINDTNYGSRWGEQAQVNASAPNAADGVGKGVLGQIQGNDARLAGGNVLRAARNNLLTAPTAAAATEVAESLASTVDGGTVTGALNATNGSFKTTNARLAEVRSGQTGMAAGNGAGHRFWGQAFGAKADHDQRSGVDGYDADTWGFAVGLDTETLSSNGILGVAFSYSDTEVDSKNANRTKSEIDTYQITLYGSYDLDQATFVNGMLAYSWHDVDTTRHNVGGIAGINARGSYDADQFSAQATVGRDYLYDSMTVTPTLLANWTRYSGDDYTETGAGNASLRVDQSTVNKFEVGAGVSAAWDYQTASGSDIVPELHAGYRYDFIGDEVSATNRFIGGGAAFNVKGADPSKHSFNVGGSLSLYSTNNWEFSANYDYDFKSDYDAHSGFVRAGVKF